MNLRNRTLSLPGLGTQNIVNKSLNGPLPESEIRESRARLRSTMDQKL